MLLAEGIGDTIRVSLATDPVEEVRVGYEILKALELRSRGPVVIACPTCGRLEVDLFKIAGEIEQATAHIRYPVSLAVMGCAVNGPGRGARGRFRCGLRTRQRRDLPRGQGGSAGLGSPISCPSW